MKYRKLGSTDLLVSVVGFGGIPVQRITKEETKSIILKAEELGMNFIDTARGYSVSEEYIGEALEGRRDKWIIATKSMSRDRESMLRDVDISLSNLKTSYIDLYQFHNVRTIDEYNLILSPQGAYGVLKELKAKGIIKHIGITSHSLDMLNVALESGYFETIMYPYNIIEKQGEEVFKRAKELNVGVIAMKPMAGGNLTDGNLAIRYIIQNENMSTAIPGMATLEEVIENAEVGAGSIPLNSEELEKARKIAQEMGTEFCRRCGYCAPCPKGIDIPSIFVIKNYKLNYNLPQWSKERYSSLKAKASDCIQCGQCEKKCPYGLPIRKMLITAKECFE